MSYGLLLISQKIQRSRIRPVVFGKTVKRERSQKSAGTKKKIKRRKVGESKSRDEVSKPRDYPKKKKTPAPKMTFENPNETHLSLSSFRTFPPLLPPHYKFIFTPLTLSSTHLTHISHNERHLQISLKKKRRIPPLLKARRARSDPKLQNQF